MWSWLSYSCHHESYHDPYCSGEWSSAVQYSAVASDPVRCSAVQCSGGCGLMQCSGLVTVVWCSAVWQQWLCKLQLSSGIRKPGSRSSHRLKRPTLKISPLQSAAEQILSLLQQNALCCCCSRVFPSTAAALHCSIFSNCPFTDFSKNLQLKFLSKGTRVLSILQNSAIHSYFAISYSFKVVNFLSKLEGTKSLEI